MKNSNKLKIPQYNSEEMKSQAFDATNLLKSLGHEGRLMILCHLKTGEKTVSELEKSLSLSQAAVSQNLARLRAEGLIKARKDGRTRRYSLRDVRASLMVEFVYHLFCADEAEAA
ncbi:MAG: winged helix-turn-helix transcriptional regulator [Rhodobacteraceae bacterium]|nr:winged helix-turn-helix transcriptional regulator [Paracoccaceae bacterium]